MRCVAAQNWAKQLVVLVVAGLVVNRLLTRALLAASSLEPSGFTGIRATDGRTQRPTTNYVVCMVRPSTGSTYPVELLRVFQR